VSAPTDHALFTVDRGVATLTLNRPEKLNSLSESMVRGAIAALERAATDPDIGCVVLTGAGRGFCAGGDVSAMGARAETAFEDRLDRQQVFHHLPWLLYSLPKVTIAAINGPCAGAGMGIALACDFRIASDHARMTTAFAKVGFAGDLGITWRLTRLVGEAKAKELLFLSEIVGAEEALRLGLVGRVVPHESLASETATLARRIAEGPRVSYRYMKENVHLSATQGYRELLDREAHTQLRCGETADHREGVAAFLEKRAPKFTGR